ncbi:MAG: ComF family protein [Saprospiraceae bacterium]|nr:ComF family protein [Saprospiraceae bacterium]
MLKYLIDIIYPHLCAACAERKPLEESCMCMSCYHEMAPSSYHETTENKVKDRFFGRLKLEYAISYFNFSKKTALQHLIHKLKYENSPEIGRELGRDYGRLLREAQVLSDIDYIIPVPLHPRKKRIRGYNQAEMFGQGLAESLGTLCSSTYLVRTVHTKTQTRKSREDRFANVQYAFQVNQKETLKGKHLLLVDDVITTGATMEACGLHLQEIEDVRLSVAAIALAG